MTLGASIGPILPPAGSGGGGGSGTVTQVSVVSANGLAGTVATSTTTPAITLSTTVTGILKGNGTTISAATAGTDYPATGVISAGGPTGSSSVVPVITWNANGQLTAVTTATITPSSIGAVSSVTNSDSTLTISPTTGAVVASLNLAHANTWTATQTYNGPGSGATQVGIDLPIITGASGTGNPIRIGGGSPTLTSLPTSAYNTAMIDIWPTTGTVTLNFANATWSAPFIDCSPTIAVQQSAAAIGLFTAGALNYNPTFTNVTTVTANLTQTVGIRMSPVIQSDGANITIGTHYGCRVSPTFQVINSGTITDGNWVGIRADGQTIGTGVTLTSVTDILVGALVNSGTVTNHYGIDMAIFQNANASAAFNNNIRIGGGTRTLTAAWPNNTVNTANEMISLLPGNLTLNFANTSIPSGLIGCTGTIQVSQSASIVGLLPNGLFNYSPVYKNTTTIAANLNSTAGYRVSPTFQADGATITLGTHRATNVSPVFGVLNAGVISSGTWVGLDNSGTIGAGVTITTWKDINLSEITPTGGGVITTRVGVDIANFSHATTNIGIRNASSTVFTNSGFQSIAAATTISPNATYVKIAQATGGNVTVTSTPTITAGQLGQFLILVNYGTSANTITLQSNGSLAGSALSLGATTRVLGAGGSLSLLYNTDISEWIEVAFNPGGHT